MRREGGGYHAWVHIADVSYFVDAGGEIEREARRRTSSLYLPLFAEPMLPAELSSDLCSLVPRQPRKCLTVEFAFDADGRRRSVQFFPSLISSDHRLTYGFVDGIIGEAGAGETGPALREAPASRAGVPDATTEADTELVAELRLAQELAEVLRRRRQARGALTIGSSEPEYLFGASGAMTGAVARPETPSHALVEEFMLAANEAVAEFLLRRKARALYRVHEPPDVASARRLWDALEELGVPVPPFPGGEAVPADELARRYGELSRIVAMTSAREGRGRIAWSSLILRSLKQARYSPANLGHFGLASPAYLHFTSPIRRYPDLVVHRSLRHQLGEGGGELGEAELTAAAEDCSTREREFARLEYDADAVALCFLLDEELKAGGWEQVFTGEITGLIGGGLFVQFAGVHEGFLPSRRLGTERLEVSDDETALVGPTSGRRYRLGDAVEVRVERIEKLRGRVDLAPAGAEGSAAGPGRPHERRPARRGGGTSPRRRSPGTTGHRAPRR